MIQKKFSNLILEYCYFLGGIGFLIKSIVHGLFHLKFERKLLVEQLYHLGTRSISLVLITAFSIGLVMTLQFGIGLAKFGGNPYVPKIVSLSILREMGPVFTSLVIAARAGAGMASEIGSMVVTQQVDAMRALGTSPIQKIVIPRVIALLIGLPILVTFANLVGVFGSLIIAVTELKLDVEFFLLKVFSTVILEDLFSGLGKCVFFSLFISITSCYYGLNVKEGTKEVGIATTRAVVTSSILVLVGDFFLTKLFYIL